MLKHFGIDPILWGVLVFVNLQAAFLSPPVAMSAFYLKGVSPSHVTHWGLYLLFFAVPLVGWAYSSAAGFPVVVYGVLPLPDFVSPDKALADAIKPWHGRLAYLMAVLVLLHVAAALKHHFIDRDGLLLRMRPGRA